MAWREVREHGSDDAEGSDAIEQDSGNESVQGIVFVALFCIQFCVHAVESSGKVEFRSYYATNDYAQYEEDGKLALRHVRQSSIHSEHKTAESETFEQHLLVLLPYSRTHQRSESTTYENGRCIKYCS